MSTTATLAPRYDWDTPHADPGVVTGRDERWLRHAIRAATTSQGGFRLGAVAVKGGSLLGRGANRHRNNPLILTDLDRDDWSIHAEQACLRDIRPGRAHGGTLYVARLSVQGQPRLARPCRACAAAAFDAGISRIVYTTNSGAAVTRPVPA